jgi:hypothetical protein
VSADRDRLAQIRAEHERTTHPDWRDATTVGVLLTELDRAEAETADLWEALAERRAVAQKLAEHADEVTAERDAAVAEAAALRHQLAQAAETALRGAAICLTDKVVVAPGMPEDERARNRARLDVADELHAMAQEITAAVTSPAGSCCGHDVTDHHSVMDGKGVFCAACQNASWHPYRAENTEES